MLERLLNWFGYVKKEQACAERLTKEELQNRIDFGRVAHACYGLNSVDRSRVMHTVLPIYHRLPEDEKAKLDSAGILVLYINRLNH